MTRRDDGAHGSRKPRVRERFHYHFDNVLEAGARGQVLWLVVVDGRQPGFSEGMSYPELADQMRQLGCWKAAALDGGGSSIMGVAGANGVLAVANSPSDRDSQGRAKIRPVPVVLTLEATSGR